MATLAATLLNDIRAGKNADIYEAGLGQTYGALNAALEGNKHSNAVVDPELQRTAAKAGTGRIIQEAVIDDKAMPVVNTRPLTIADFVNDSALFNYGFITYTVNFTMVPAEYMNNEIKYRRDFTRKAAYATRALQTALDTAAVAKLEADKSQVLADTLGYSVVGNALQFPLASHEKSFADTVSIAESNEINVGGADYIVIGNTGIMSTAQYITEFGENNQQNKQRRLFNKTFHRSQRIANGVGELANMYVLNGGAIGMLARYERDAMMNNGRGNTNKKGESWELIKLPGTELVVSMFSYDGASDESALSTGTADMTRSNKQHFSMSLDAAFSTGYISNRATKAGPVVKSTLLSV